MNADDFHRGGAENNLELSSRAQSRDLGVLFRKRNRTHKIKRFSGLAAPDCRDTANCPPSRINGGDGSNLRLEVSNVLFRKRNKTRFLPPRALFRAQSPDARERLPPLQTKFAPARRRHPLLSIGQTQRLENTKMQRLRQGRGLERRSP